MSNSLLDTFLHYGTAAQRAAFVPDPPVIGGVPVPVLYEWRETDTGDTYVYDTAWHKIAGSGVGGITQLTGDLTAGPGSGSVVGTLAASGVTAATYGDATHVAQVTVNAKGLVTAAANVAVTGGGGSGAVVQVVNTETGAYATGSTTIPLDDTIPQNTEGDQYMSLAITPTNAAHKLRIDIVFFGAVTAGGAWLIVALFQDSTANALAAFANFQNIGGTGNSSVFTHYMTAGTTSATTFKVRAGSGGGVMAFNGHPSLGRWFGGVMASSITITEIIP